MALTFTLTFLLVFGLLSQASLDRYVAHSISRITSRNSSHLQAQSISEKERLIFENYTATAQLNNSKATVNYQKKGPKTLPENQSHLKEKRYHFKEALNLHDLLKKDSVHKLHEDVFIALFEKLYKNQPFYKDSLAKDLLETLRKLVRTSENGSKKKVKIEKPEDLASLNLKDPELQAIFYKILKGCEVEGKKGGYPSLCKFLIVHNYSTKINLYSAPYEILSALFNDETANYIIENKALWKKDPNESLVNHGNETLKKIEKKYGKGFSEKVPLITFRAHSK
ncbi:MAG: hypothetical protein S4CHLAM7_09860 [Chlamydiae bacterium]|nr:hypothetical protein [Chlamydiota bacterium]